MRTRRGSVMIVTLAVLAGLMAVLVSAAASQRVAFRAGINRMEARRAELAAQAGLQYVLASLTSQEEQPSTTLQDDWANLGQNGAERFLVGDASFRIEVVDAASRLNLNQVSREQLERLGLTDEQIDSLQDWREFGTTPRTDGAKDDFYNYLPEPYNAKLRRLDTPDELLLIRGFTPSTLYAPLKEALALPSGLTTDAPALVDLVTVDSVSEDATPDGQAKLNVNAQGSGVEQLVQRAQISPLLAAQIVQRRTGVGPFTSMAQVLQMPGVSLNEAENVLNYLSTTGSRRAEGRLNLNTISETVLNTFEDLSPDLVQNILARQSSGFTGLGELATLPGMSVPILASLVDRFTVNSQVFLVRVVGEAGATRVAYEATINWEGDAPKMVRFGKLPADFPERWGWSDEPDSETTIVEGL